MRKLKIGKGGNDIIRRREARDTSYLPLFLGPANK